MRRRPEQLEAIRRQRFLATAAGEQQRGTAQQLRQRGSGLLHLFDLFARPHSAVIADRKVTCAEFELIAMGQNVRQTKVVRVNS